jgi:protein-ribulosamine 3-kinase
MGIDLEYGAAIARELGLDEHPLEVVAVSGGEIARTHVLKGADHWIFVKSLSLGRSGLLSAEADGLEAIARTHTLRVPRVIGRGMLDDTAWLALEYLPLDERTPAVDARLGRQLAEMHRSGGERFGWHRNNYIGLTPQHNPLHRKLDGVFPFPPPRRSIRPTDVHTP